MPSLPSSESGDHAISWQTVTTETLEWEPTIPSDLLSRAQRERYKGSYEAALVPFISSQTPRITPSATTAAEEASLAIARFDSELGGEVAPFSSVLLRSESASSSQIENLSSGAKQIALAELGSREKGNATEIVGNVAAMKAALALADHLDTDAILTMHHALLERQDPKIAGKWRTDQVWIGGTSIGPHDAEYVAPAARHVPELMNDLIAFTQRSDIPSLILTAIAHAQFETIHPFPDGNGRTGRALVQAMVRRQGLTHNVTVPISAGLLTDTRRYFDTLNAYREGDVSPIIETMSHAALSAVHNGNLLVSDLRQIRSHWNTMLRVRRDSSAHRLANVLLRQPVIDTKTTAAELRISPDNAGRAIRPLVEAGILTEFTGFNRNRMWTATEVTKALDAFAARAMRRDSR